MTGQDKGDLLIQVTAREGFTVYSICVRLRLTSNHQIQVRFLHHRHLYLRSMYFFKFSNLWPFLTFWNQRPMTSLMFALSNKLAIDLRIWKGRWFENTLNRAVIWDSDISGCRFEECTLISVYHIFSINLTCRLKWY